VYKARQLSLNRFVALKTVLGQHAELDRRFRREASVIAQLQHPNIVQVYDFGEQEDLFYLALEFVEGGSLAAKLQQSKLSAMEAVALVATLAQAMHYAHVRGIVHRDLKPSNILLTVDGTPKIADFGLAKQLDLSITRVGDVLGTPGYMAPEQAMGDNQAVGPPMDVYALGTVLYELLTGRLPFAAANMLDLFKKVAHEDPPPPSRVQPQVAPELDLICLKCLRKEPDQRYVSMEALANDLKEFLARH
jgi:serine/threonine-protein kinase